MPPVFRHTSEVIVSQQHVMYHTEDFFVVWQCGLVVNA